ncbi:hypothetical protein F3Y22_tig00112738pilonHSYRG00472 [Hibiscus syriacus]|uniref:Uncharacterized protein n=1 Tax=Hibiscus syriacus TaxID=106335 RepID=A0A6A2WTW1_HIBSY|nr:hypothetical protein F3Y22_tig00112738pilonHSYRG00472 [Hibiscus syriacus]
MGEEENRPAEEKKMEEKKVEEDEKKGYESKGEYAQQPQEVILKVYIYCEGCALKVHCCLKGFQGVEDLLTDCKSNKVVQTSTLWDMTPNSAITMSLGVVPIPEKLREGRLRWFGHVLRRQPSDAVRRVESITVDGARRRGRPRRKWEDCLRFDLKDLALTEDMTSDRKVWRLKIRVTE